MKGAERVEEAFSSEPFAGCEDSEDRTRVVEPIWDLIAEVLRGDQHALNFIRQHIPRGSERAAEVVLGGAHRTRLGELHNRTVSEKRSDGGGLNLLGSLLLLSVDVLDGADTRRLPLKRLVHRRAKAIPDVGAEALCWPQRDLDDAELPIRNLRDAPIRRVFRPGREENRYVLATVRLQVELNLAERIASRAGTGRSVLRIQDAASSATREP